MSVGTPIGTELDLTAFEDRVGGPHVVAIGGGHGLAATLEAIRTYASDTTAIVSVGDDGGSSGRLTAGLGIPPPGDIRRCLLALTADRSVWSDLFAYRFPPSDRATATDSVDIGGHSLGNLIIAALTDLDGDFSAAVSRAGSLLGTMGTVVPAADRAVELQAVVSGAVVDGQVNIAKGRGRVESLTVGPEGVVAHPKAVEAIRSADQIVIAAGSLYTSVIAALGVPGIASAVNAAKAPITLVLNMVTEDGETLGLTGQDHLDALVAVGGLTRAGGIVAHEGPTPVTAPLDVVQIDDGEAERRGWSVVKADLGVDHAPRALHDPVKLGAVLSELM